MTHHGRSRGRKALLTLGGALALALGAAGTADALIHSWNCTRYQGNHCTDPDTAHHTWIETNVATGGGTYVPELCVKAKTEAGNIRSTTWGNPCGYDKTQVGRCLTSSTPTSRVYSYWWGFGGQITLYTSAVTPSDSYC